MIKLLIVDDHNLFREGLASIIQSEPDIEIVGLAGTVRDAVEITRQLKPDIILMDFGLPDGNGVDATRLILHEHPDCKIIFLTVNEEDDSLFAAIRSGAKGYLLKNIRSAKLMAALRAVQQGESALSRSMTMRLMEEFSRTKEPDRQGDKLHGKLTPREVEILRELSAGMSNQQIADHLFLSENTVKYHVHSILDKLNLEDRKAAASYARENRLV
ncbi:MAG: response regulator [Omnitrophica WOR_2 bacterium]